MADWVSKIGAASFDEKTSGFSCTETHISWVFLTDGFAYKVKKPVDFGFCNFIALDLRKKYCERELIKNRLLCPDIYLAVLPVYFDGAAVQFGGQAKGELVDYCVKMIRLPEERKMSGLLMHDEVSERDILRIAEIVRDFHDALPVSAAADKYGSYENVRAFCEQNFEQTEKYIGGAVMKRDFEFIAGAARGFLEENRGLFDKRARGGFVKDCHGDLHSENIFILGGGDVKIFDALEFNLALSVTDILSDIAFMAMDLDFHGRNDFAEKFVGAYGVKDGALLNFYKCYRAYVRGKVACFSDDFEKAKRYFDLAKEYAVMM